MAEDEIAVEFISAYALMLCVGTKEDKAKAFYNILQEGGLEAHEFIGANDKDFGPVFEKMASVTTYELFKFMDSAAATPNQYNEDELTQLEEAHVALREDVFLDAVYGSKSKLPNADWLKAAAKTSWLWDASSFRGEVLDQAGLSLKQP